MTRLLLIMVFLIPAGWSGALLADWQTLQPPTESYINNWHFERLELEHSDEFYQAYQSSQYALYNSLGWGWPTAQITPEINDETVRLHYEQHSNGASYSFAIRDATHGDMHGALYVAPVQQRPGSSGFQREQYQVEITFWLNQDGQSIAEADYLLPDILAWLQDSWQVTQAILPVHRNNSFARRQFEANALERVSEDRTTHELLYRFRAR